MMLDFLMETDHMLYHMILPRAVKCCNDTTASNLGQYRVPPDTGAFLDSISPGLRTPKHEFCS